MEIKATNTATINNKTVNKLQDLLIKFENTLFKAIITNKVSSQTFVINSQLGSLQITSPLELQMDDELTLKIKPGVSPAPPTLEVSKIERPSSPKQITDPLKIEILKPNNATQKIIITNKEALNQVPKHQDHFIAKIVAQDKSSLHLQDLKGRLFSLSKINFSPSTLPLKNEERLVVKWLQANKVEIQPISKENLLHQAQRQLLPKYPQSQQTHQRLTQAAFKLFQSIKDEPTIQPSRLPSAEKLVKSQIQPQPILQVSSVTDKIINTIKNEIKKNIFFKNNVTTTSIEVSKAPDFEQAPHLDRHVPTNLQRIKVELQQLLKAHPITLKTLSAENIQKLLIHLNVIDRPLEKGTAPTSFVQKLSMIKQSIDQLLNEIDVIASKNKNIKDDSELLSNFLKTTLKESKQAFESTIHKLMFQNTTSKLNQEVNLTQLINTQIPFESDKQTKDLNLKIKQQKKTNENDDDFWEIQLSLEMGLLGFMSTKILLRNSIDVSVLFWAEQANTKQLIEDKKAIFHQQMKNAGFNIDKINVFLGKQNDNGLPSELAHKKFIDINV